MGAEQDRIRRAALQGLASAEAQKQVQFGENFADTMGGYGQGAKNYIMGGLGDLIGNVSGFMGDEDTAARMAFESDELYRRGGEFFDQGLAGGENYLDASSMPITPQEKSARASSLDKLLLEQNQKTAKFSELVDAGGPYDAGFDPFLQTGKPNTTAIRKEGESKDDFRNRILNEQSVTSSYDFEGPQSLSPAQIMQQKINDLIDVEASSAGGRGNRQSGEAIGEREQFLDETVPLDGERDMDAASTAFMEALAETNKAKGQEQPKAESRADLLEKYKQEFAEATGIEIDGKPDNSQALMAMGLSLMQNRAGKGFNIGKILNAAGVAGEKAMPYIAKASSEAKAASLAAGKYALGRIQEGESAAAAFAKELRTHNRAYQLEKYKIEQGFRLEELKQEGKKGKLDDGKERISVGGNKDLKLGLARSDGRLVFTTPAQDAANISSAYVKYTDGLDNIDVMTEALNNIAAAQGGGALKRLKDSAATLAVTFGLADPETMFGEGGISDADKFKVYQQATINAFKKLILQESQVSNLDLTTLFASFGEVGFMDSPQKANAAIDKMMDYMMTKRSALQPFIEDFYNEDMYLNTEDYNNTQKKLEVFGVQPPSRASSGEGGRMSLNLATIAPFRNTDNTLVNPNITVGDSGQLKYTSPSKTG